MIIFRLRQDPSAGSGAPRRFSPQDACLLILDVGDRGCHPFCCHQRTSLAEKAGCPHRCQLEGDLDFPVTHVDEVCADITDIPVPTRAVLNPSPFGQTIRSVPSTRRILVTGGCGFIGSNLVRRLIERTSHRVLNVDALTYAGNLNSLVDIEQDNRYAFQKVDLRDLENLRSVVETFRPTSVIHLAAESHVDRSIDSPGTFIETNVVGTYHLLHCCLDYFRNLTEEEQQAFRFLHVSTDEVYGSLNSEDSGFCESTPYSPHSPYSASKAASDHLARAWSDTYGLPVLVTNCSNNYGPFQFPEKLIPAVILKSLRGEQIPVYGTGENVRDWLHVEDHCTALLAVLDRGRAGQTYNIGGNNEQKNIDLVRTLCEILDDLRPRDNGLSYVEQITFVSDRPGHDLRYAVDASKIKLEIGWEPAQDHRSGFRQTVQWYLDNESWWQQILSGDYQLNRQGVTVGGNGDQAGSLDDVCLP